MKIEFRKEQIDYWVIIRRDNGERALCGLLMDKHEVPFWRIWEDDDIPSSLDPIDIWAEGRSEEQIATAIESAIKQRPEYIRFFES